MKVKRGAENRQPGEKEWVDGENGEISAEHKEKKKETSIEYKQMKFETWTQHKEKKKETFTEHKATKYDRTQILLLKSTQRLETGSRRENWTGQWNDWEAPEENATPGSTYGFGTD